MSRAHRFALHLFFILGGGIAVWHWSSLLAPSAARAGEQAAELQHRLHAAKDLIQWVDAAPERVAQEAARLSEQCRGFVPSPEDPFGWAIKQVSYAVELAGLRLRSVDRSFAPLLPERRDAAPRHFLPYRIHVLLEGSESQCLAFLRGVEQANPYVVIAELKLHPPALDSGSRQMQVTMEWPAWADTTGPHSLAAINRRAAAEDAVATLD